MQQVPNPADINIENDLKEKVAERLRRISDKTKLAKLQVGMCLYIQYMCVCLCALLRGIRQGQTGTIACAYASV